MWSEDVAWLVDLSGVRGLVCGWSVVIRAELCDPSPGRPKGLSYALILNDESGNRILGLDNSHAFDGATAEDPFDHEHRPGKAGQRFPYGYVDCGQLLKDFLDRVEAWCDRTNTPFDFEDDSDDQDHYRI